MNLSRPLPNTLFSLLLLLFLFATAQAGDGHKHHHRQHGSHQHGLAQLDLALSGKQLHMAFHSPAINLVGFEHAPRNSAQRHLIKQALQRLQKGQQMFELSKAALCQLASAEAKTNQAGMGKQTDNKKHRDKDAHGDFSVVYLFECAKPEKLHSLRVRLFDYFPATKTIKVRLLSEQGQQTRRLSAKDHTLSIRQ